MLWPGPGGPSAFGMMASVTSLNAILLVRPLWLFRRLALRELWRQVGELSRIGVVHLRRHAVPGERVSEHGADFRLLIDIVNLVATDALADPGDRHALRVPRRRNLMLEGEVTR